MLTVEEARERVLSHFHSLPVEEVSLNEALGRVLAEDAVSREALPAFANSAMDGYALRAADSAGASAEAPRRLRLAGEAAAGRVYQGGGGPGEGVGILTGAPLPEGAGGVRQQGLGQITRGRGRPLAGRPPRP